MIFSMNNKKMDYAKYGYLRLAFLNESNSLDPRFGYEMPANLVVKMLFDGLMRLSPTGEVVPSIAESVEISEDKKTYVFHIRSSRWSNGAEVTADDFEYAWKDIINPKTGAKGASDFYPIKNVEKIMQGKIPFEEAGVYAIDSKTLVVELEHPTPYFLELTTTSAYSPVYVNADKIHPDWADYSAPVFISNGPFVLKSWKKGYELVLEKNPLYWDAPQVKLPGIHIAIIEDVVTHLRLFEREELDWYGKPFAKLALDAVPTLKQSGRLQIYPEFAVYWYWINTTQFPFNNKKIRQAFAYALHREEVTKYLLQEGEIPALGIIPEFRDTRPAHFQDNDLEKARALFDEGLKELNITKEQFPNIPLSYCGIEVNQRLALVVQQQWQKAFGITVELLPQEWTSYYDNLSKMQFLLGGMSWHSRTRDPIYNLQVFKFRSNGLNMTNWENSRYQEILDAASEEVDAGKRKKLLYEAEALLMDEMPVIPIYNLSISFIKKNNLKDVSLSQLNYIDFKWAYFDQMTSDAVKELRPEKMLLKP